MSGAPDSWSIGSGFDFTHSSVQCSKLLVHPCHWNDPNSVGWGLKLYLPTPPRSSSSIIWYHQKLGSTQAHHSMHYSCPWSCIFSCCQHYTTHSCKNEVNRIQTNHLFVSMHTCLEQANRNSLQGAEFFLQFSRVSFGISKKNVTYLHTHTVSHALHSEQFYHHIISFQCFKFISITMLSPSNQATNIKD